MRTCRVESKDGHFKPFDIGGDNLVVIAGPCSLESYELGIQVGEVMREVCTELGFEYIFKASFDKANRTSIKSWRGPGIETGLEQLSRIGKALQVPTLTDIHEAWQADVAAQSVDMLQIPAFLCRQTDLLVAAAKTQKPINIKKAQFLAPEDMLSALNKCRDSGGNACLCERGATMGYHELVVDMRSLVEMRAFDCPIIFDATHSVQKPGAGGTASGGDRRFILPLSRAAVAIGIDGIFIETHPKPSEAKCDGPNMIPLERVREYLRQIKKIDSIVRNDIGFTEIDFMEKT
ncbi:MAG: 3-deoxy-8-phosphooctulonate synthase [Synergistaceae bacterium]|nr:3-deoxy-8-phosphooctulonate synthase [Synergistaceae bacterium]